MEAICFSSSEQAKKKKGGEGKKKELRGRIRCQYS
jgi:hypothetical protein